MEAASGRNRSAENTNGDDRDGGEEAEGDENEVATDEEETPRSFNPTPLPPIAINDQISLVLPIRFDDNEFPRAFALLGACPSFDSSAPAGPVGGAGLHEASSSHGTGHCIALGGGRRWW